MKRGPQILLAIWTGTLSATAQLSAPLNITCSVGIRDADGILLPGSNPYAPDPVPGALVQIIAVGPNGIPDLPNADGSVGSNDVLLATACVGQGMAPNLTRSGRFDLNISPPPADNTKIFARVFDATTPTGATHWGQSAVHSVNGTSVTVMDVAQLGLWVTGMRTGVDPTTTDSDGDGVLDADELAANTHADNPGDSFRAEPATVHSISFSARAGRGYRLLRTTDSLTQPLVNWVNVASVGPLVSNLDLTLTDPNPLESSPVFYRLEAYTPVPP